MKLNLNIMKLKGFSRRGVDLKFKVASKEEVTKRQIIRSRWSIVTTSSRNNTVRKLFPRMINGFFVAWVARLDFLH